MTTTVAQGIGNAGTPAGPAVGAVPSQAAHAAGPVEAVLPPTTQIQPPARTPAAIMGLGTKALATAIVVRTCPPGHLLPALDALDGSR